MKNNQKQNKSINWWITKILSGIAFVYLMVSLIFPNRVQASNDGTSTLKTEHIILFAIILLFNSDFFEKIESFSFGDLSAKFATKEEVDKLGEELDTLLIATILDSYEYVTLQKVKGNRKNDNYVINPDGRDQLKRILNRGLIDWTLDKQQNDSRACFANFFSRIS